MSDRSFPVSNHEVLELLMMPPTIPSAGSDQPPNSFDEPPVWVWGVPLAPYTSAQALARIDELITRRVPSYFITANLHYARLTEQQARLREVNDRAAFVLADGMPLVWASRRQARSLPERVAGSDLLFWICERAARKGWRVFLLGAGPGIAAQAAENLCRRYPGLQIAGTESPPFRTWTAQEKADLFHRIRESKADLLFVAFGQPKGEIWVADHFQELGVPLAVQVGASLDFAAGRVRRAPRWIQRTGLEWIYRIAQEPRRLFLRYMEDIVFLLRMLFGSAGRKLRRD